MRVALLTSGPPFDLKVLYCLQSMGAETDVIDLRGTSLTKYSRYRSGYERLIPPAVQGEVDRVWKSLEAYIERRGPKVVVPSDIFSAGLLFELKDRLEARIFPVSDSETLDTLDNKWRFYEFLVTHGLPTPKSILLRTPSDIEELSDTALSCPFLVKPLYGESSHGIVRLNRTAEISDYVKGGSRYASLPLLVQELAPGYDADLSVLAVDGGIVTYVIQSRRQAGALEFIHNDKVLELGRWIVRLANYSGVANIDMRIDEVSNGVEILECNPRFWYTLQASMWRGTNFVRAGIDAAMGRARPSDGPHSGIYYLHGHLLKHVSWNPLKWSQIEKYNWQGLLQALTDPLPFLDVRSSLRFACPCKP